MTQEWLDRVNKLLQVQRDRRLDLISANFTCRELIELKLMIETLMEYKYKKVDAIIIPDGATNGDMIKVMFPNLNFTNVLAKMYAQNGKTLSDWWNTPYKKEMKE